MNKESSTYLGYGLMVLAIFVYGIHTKKRWRYWVLTMLFIAPVGGGIGYALGKAPEELDSTKSTPPTFIKPTLPDTDVSDYEFDPLNK